MTVTMPASHSRRKSGVRSGVVSAKSRRTLRLQALDARPSRVTRILLCTRFSRPCQNSTTSGAIRYPPQFGGTGTASRSANRSVTSASCCSSAARDAIGLDWCDAHAPSCEPRGRLDQ